MRYQREMHGNALPIRSEIVDSEKKCSPIQGLVFTELLACFQKHQKSKYCASDTEYYQKPLMHSETEALLAMPVTVCFHVGPGHLGEAKMGFLEGWLNARWS